MTGDRSRNLRTLPPCRAALAATSTALFVVAAAVALRVRRGTGPLRVDQTASRIVGLLNLGGLPTRAHDGPSWPRSTLVVVARYGLPAGAVAVVAGLAFLAWHRGDIGATVLCLLGPFAAVVLCDVVAKPLVGRHRHGHLAYPSGHAAGAAAFAALGLLLLHRWGGFRALVWFAPLTLALPVVMGVALVRLGWHYPTDVVGGIALGGGTVFGLAAAVIAPNGSARAKTGSPGPQPGTR